MITQPCCTNESERRASGPLSGTCRTSGPVFLSSASLTFPTAADPTCFGSPIWRIDQITSSAVNGEPSCHLTSGRSLISYFVAVGVRRPREREPRRLREVRIDAHQRVVEVVGARRVDERRAAARVERLALAAADVADAQAPAALRRRRSRRSSPHRRGPRPRAALRRGRAHPHAGPSCASSPSRPRPQAVRCSSSPSGVARSRSLMVTRMMSQPMLALLYDAGWDPMTADGTDAAVPRPLGDRSPTRSRACSRSACWPAPGPPGTASRRSPSSSRCSASAAPSCAMRCARSPRADSSTCARDRAPSCAASPRSPTPTRSSICSIRSDVTLADLAKAREAIDLMLAERAAVERSDDDIARLRAAYDDLCAAAGAADWTAAESAHLRFHVVLVEAVHLPGLEVLLRPLQRIIVDTSLPPDSQRARVVGRPVAPADPRGDRGARPGRGGRGDAQPLRALRRAELRPTCSRGACATCRAPGSPSDLPDAQPDAASSRCSRSWAASSTSLWRHSAAR